MIWKRLSAFIVSIVLLLPFEQWVHACGGDINPYDEYPSFFMPNVTGSSAYTPFYYSDYLVFYDEGWGWSEWAVDSPTDMNIKEWQAYCNNEATEADIDSFVYKYGLQDLTNLYTHLEKGKALQVPEEVKGNSFTKWLVKTKDTEALGYLMYAKKCEPYAQAEEGHYDRTTYEWVTMKRDTVKMGKLVKDGLQLHKAAKSEFIKWRYTFQALRMSFYSYKYQQTLDLYRELVGEKTADNIMYPRCLSMMAGAMYRMRDKLHAAYNYSRVFDLSDDAKRVAYQSYKWCEIPNEQVLAQCKNDHERAVIYLMDALYEREGQEMEGLALMEKAYQLDNSIDGLNVAMSREMNKAEQRYMMQQYARQSPMTTQYGTYWFSNSEEDKNKEPEYREYLKKLDALAQRIAAEGKRKESSFWLLSSSYIQYMLGDYPASRKMMEAARKGDMTDEERSLYELLNTLYIIRENGKVDNKTEDKVLASLKWLEKKAEGNQQFTKMYADMMVYVLTNTYLQQKDTIKAIFACAKTLNAERYDPYAIVWYSPGILLDNMSVEALLKVEDFMQRKNKSPYEEWLLKGTIYSMDMLKELEGTKYTRAYEFDKAIKAYEQVPKDIVTYYKLPDAFVEHTDDWLEEEPADTLKRYNRLTFAREMLHLQNKLEKTPADAATAYRYATGLYNMTYYGKANHAYTYFRGSTDNDAYYNTAGRKKMPLHQQDFYGAMTAEKYYMQAFEHTTDKELKAKCLFMAAKCWQKRCPVPEKGEDEYFWGYGNDEYYVNSLQSPYLKRLVDEYDETMYYNEAYNTCSYLRSYVNKR